jgi:hypothetical protein
MTEEHNHAHHEGHQSAHHEGLGLPKVDMKKVNKDSLKGGFSDFIEIMKLNKGRINAVAGRESEGIGVALVYLIVGAIGAPLGGAILGYSYFGIAVRVSLLNALVGAVLAAVVAAVVLYVTNLLAIRVFKGKGTFPQYFRVMGYAYLLSFVGFLTLVPVLGSLASIYILVVNFIALQEIHKLDATNSVLTILLTVAVFVLLSFVLASITATMGLGVISGVGMMYR